MKELIKKGYNQIGQAYNDSRVSKKGLNYQYFNELMSFFPKNGTLLDLGCGGAIPATSFFFEKGFDVVGVDLSSKMIELAKKNIPEGDFFEKDICACAFMKEEFDLILSTYALIHIPQEEQVPLFEKIYFWLKKGGKTFFNLGTSNYKKSIQKDWHGTEMAWSSFSPKEYQVIFNEIGFKTIWEENEDLPNGERFYNVILEK